ncbi:LOW QUALITY PROTEIN: Hypothetical protein PHPALM_11517 [Phytophthora palmivora]|uniref:Uncharacterized protein n=1 Tax=Phytophthora palmivora TaxID=4796 RepID=A0A2P4Y237_9STRA|nr:LOW QUALITY PROTEIN: Hypothetical protein PHPALM_11517 [Phytophthora palmivora]
MEEGDQTTQWHCEFLKNFRRYLVNHWQTYCATTTQVATRLAVLLIGCAPRRFNLAVNAFLETRRETVDAHADAGTLHNQQPHCYAQHTELTPLCPNGACGSTVYAMIARYVRIRDAVKKLEAVFDVIPKAAVHRRIGALLTDLQIFNSVTVKLQIENLSLEEPYLKASANVVQPPVYEAVAVKSDAIRKFARLVSGSKRKLVNEEEQRKMEEDFATSVLRYSEILLKPPLRASLLTSQTGAYTTKGVAPTCQCGDATVFADEPCMGTLCDVQQQM